jgi:membrane protease YdiL (CAAX protease family)
MVLAVLLISRGLQAGAAVGLLWMVERPWMEAIVRDGARWGDGFYWAALTLVSGPVEVVGVVFGVRLRGCGSVRGYLAWHGLSCRELTGWVGVALGLVVLLDWVTWLAGRPVVPDVLADAYLSAGSAPLFWLAMVGVAPLSEEILFRGFLYRGLERSRWGAAGAILGSGLLWTFMHGQYDVWGILIVLLAGVVVGVARWRSGSVVVPWVMHVTLNTVALLQASLVARA